MTFIQPLLKIPAKGNSLYRALADVGKICLESSELLCWRTMEKVIWIDRVRNKKCYIGSWGKGISYKQ
jgi:hypothetical protein